VLVEGAIGVLEGSEKGGCPIVEGGGIVFVDVMKNVSSELVGDRGLGTRTEELSFGLEVMEAILKFSNGFRKGRVNFSEVCVGVGRGAERVAEEAGTSGDFSGGVPRVLIDVADSGLEAVAVPRREIWKWRGAGSRGKEMSFGKGKFDAKRFAKFGKGVEEVGDVSIGECGRGVVNDGGGVGLRAECIIVRRLVVEAAEFGTFKEFRVDLFEEDGESEGGEEGTKGVALGKTFGLNDGVPGVGRGTDPRSVGVGVKDIEKADDGRKGGIGSKDVMTGVTRDFIEHVDEVKEEDGAGGGSVMREVAVDKGLCRVNDEVGAAGNGNTELTIGKEEFDDLVVKDFHDE
jgi:hypothetical protein